jgi:hypothetical protein
VKVGVERELFAFLENRVDKIEVALKLFDARLISLESAVKEFNFDEVRKRLQAIDAKIVNIESEQRVAGIHFRAHTKRCWCTGHFSGGFSQPEEVLTDAQISQNK